MRIVAYMLVLVGLIFILTIPAYADMVVEPDNDFYKENQYYIVLLERVFHVNASSGFTSIKKAPGERSEIARVDNVEILYVRYSCLYNGEFWGLTTIYPKSKQDPEYEGWVRMDNLLVAYDYIAFAEEHSDEFHAFEGDIKELVSTEAALAWPWPGADAPLWKIEGLDTENFRVSVAYTDDVGREWGFITYLYGSRNIWICLTDPINSEIPSFNPAPPPVEWVSNTEHIDIGVNKNDIPVLIIILVTSVVLVTFILIKVFWRTTKSD